MPIHKNSPAVSLFFSDQQLQQCTFSRSGRSHDEDKFAIGNIQRQVFDGLRSIGIDLGDVL